MVVLSGRSKSHAAPPSGSQPTFSPAFSLPSVVTVSRPHGVWIRYVPASASRNRYRIRLNVINVVPSSPPNAASTAKMAATVPPPDSGMSAVSADQ